MPTFTTTVNIVFEVLATAIREEKEIKGIQIRKEEVKLTICRWHILYIENSKDSTGILLELISECSKVTGYEINTKKSLAFLYINNETSKREVKETIPFTTATKRTKYQEINQPKQTKELYAENYETLTDEKNQRWHKQMERHTKFLDWKNQYSENDYITPSNLQIWCYLYSNFN